MGNGNITIDGLSIQLSLLLFEAVACFLCALVYSVTRDPLRIRKSVVLSLNISCGFMLVCEFLFYIYLGSKDPFDVIIMHIVNAAVYYLIVLLLLFYAMLVFLKIFGRFDVKHDMPCRKRFWAIQAIIAVEIILVTISQFTGIYYYFDSDNVYHRGPLFMLSAILPSLGVVLVATVIIQYRKRITRSQRLVLLSYLILPLAGEIVQVAIYGNSLLNICMGLSVLMMFFENVIYKEKEILRVTKTEIRMGLANELGTIEWLNSMRGKDELREYAAVFFDLRKFSDINRKYGIENGNRVLANFGKIMAESISEDEILGRQFGNQFVAIVKNSELDRILKLLKGVDVPFVDSQTGLEKTVTLSSRIGVYKIDRTDLDGENFLIFAAQALVSAKSKDSDDIVWLTRDLLDETAERKKFNSDINAGLKNGEFMPYYQPKVNIRTGKMCGMEALTRWIHDGKTISPGMFVPVMEANETICNLDIYMLKCVCKDIAGWINGGIDVPVVSINFSRRNLADPDLAGKINDVVRTFDIPHNLIEIEVTETVDEFSISILRNFVDELHSLGYNVSIDDFGSASSSLTLLREVAFDSLKIDKGFVNRSKGKDLTILSNIIRLAKEIDLDIVAEGVEQKEQLDMLDNLGVDVIQGFYFDRPLPKDEITVRLRSSDYSI